MGASNFHNENASNIFYVNLENDIDNFNYNCLVENLEYEFSQLENFSCVERKVLSEISSYPTKMIGELYDSKTFGDCDICVNIRPLIRSAYHEGNNLDYEVVIEIEGDEGDQYENNEIPPYCFEYANSEMNEGMLKIQSQNALKWGNKRISELIEQTEQIFKEYAERELTTVATFSNGERYYQEVK